MHLLPTNETLIIVYTSIAHIIYTPICIYILLWALQILRVFVAPSTAFHSFLSLTISANAYIPYVSLSTFLDFDLLFWSILDSSTTALRRVWTVEFFAFLQNSLVFLASFVSLDPSIFLFYTSILIPVI